MKRFIEIGLLIIIIYTPLLRATKQIPVLTATYILVFILTCLWFLKMNQKRTFKFVSTPLNLPLVLFLFFALLSTIFSINKGSSLTELYKVAVFILIYFLLVNNLRERYHFQVAVSAVLGGGSMVAGYGIYEYFSHWPNLREIASTFSPNPNSLAGYLLLILPLAIAFTLWSSSKWLSRLAFVTASLAFFALLATHSRGGYLAFTGSIAIFVFLARKRVRKRRKRLLPLLGMLLLIFASLFTIQIILKPRALEKTTQFLTELKPYSSAKVTVQEPSDISPGEPVSTRFFSWQRSPANKFIIDRLQIWERTLRIIRDYPFLGTGMGTYGIIFKKHKIPVSLTSETIARYGLSARFTHNEYLQIAAETGLPSLVIFLWIITIIFRTGLRTLRISPDTPLPRYPDTPIPRYLTIGLLSGLTGLLLHSLVDFVLRPPATGILFVYFAALIMLQTSKGNKCDPRPAMDDGRGMKDEGRAAIRDPRPAATLFRHLYHSPLIRGSLIVCITLILAGQVTLPWIAYRHYRKGINQQKNEAFDQAISSYFSAQKLAPTNDRYHKKLGDLYRHLAFFSKEEKEFWLREAIKEYEEIVSLSPRDNHYRRDLGVIYWLASQGRDRLLMNEAIAQFRESLRIDPTFSFSSCTLGKIYAKMGWADEALEKFQRAVYYEPNYVEARYNLAILYSQKGLYNRALSEYEKIIEIEQRNLFPRIACGYDKALLQFDYILAHFQLASLYEKEGRGQEAKVEYEHLLKLRPDFAPAKKALDRLKR